MNAFERYLKKRHISGLAFSRLSNVSLSTVYRAIHGERIFYRSAKKILRHCSPRELSLKDFGYEDEDKN